MNRHDAMKAVKEAINGGSFYGTVDVFVENGANTYIYKNIWVNVSYNVGYEQMDIDIIWDDDKKQPKFTTLGLHAGYNSNYQDFHNTNRSLCWKDGKNHILIDFSHSSE